MNFGNRKKNERTVSKKLRRKRSPHGQKLTKNHNSSRKRCKPSSRWKKLKLKIGKVHQTIANRCADWCHKVAAQILSDNSLVATEDLNLKEMTKKAKKGLKRKRQKTGLNRSLLEVGIGMLKSAICYKLDVAGGVFIALLKWMRYKLPGFKAVGRRRSAGGRRKKNNPKSKIQNPKSLNRTSLN